MRVKYLLLLFVILFVCSEGVSKGQSTESTIRAMVDSFEQEKPSSSNKIRAIGSAFVIKVKTQDDFDAINDNITKAVVAGKTNIKVKLANGLFCYCENHILRKNENYPNVSITIEGRKHTILTSDQGLTNGSSTIQSAWREMLYANGPIEIIDEGKKLCIIPYTDQFVFLGKTHFTKIQVTEWFRAPIYEVQRIDDKGFYFVASDLQKTALMVAAATM